MRNRCRRGFWDVWARFVGLRQSSERRLGRARRGPSASCMQAHACRNDSVITGHWHWHVACVNVGHPMMMGRLIGFAGRRKEEEERGGREGSGRRMKTPQRFNGTRDTKSGRVASQNAPTHYPRQTTHHHCQVMLPLLIYNGNRFIMARPAPAFQTPSLAPSPSIYFQITSMAAFELLNGRQSRHPPSTGPTARAAPC